MIENEKLNCEDFLTHEDFKRININIDDQELEKLNGHSLGDGEKRSTGKLEVEADFIPIQLNLVDFPKIRKDYLGLNFCTLREKKVLDKTPIEDIHFLNPQTKVVGRTKNKNAFRQGFLTEEAVVKRLLNKEGKWPVKKNMYPYLTLKDCSFSFQDKYTYEPVNLRFLAENVFWAPKSGENTDKRKEMLKSRKK